MRLMVMSILAVTMVGCRGDDGGKSSGNNSACESNCTAEYADAVSHCEDATASCMAGCSSVDDTECMWDCEDHEMDCTMDFTLCIADCPCAAKVASCTRDCDFEDDDCLMDCSNEYLSCAEANSAYTCANTCDAQKAGCVWDCEDLGNDTAVYLACRQECATDHQECVDACAN